MTSNIPLNGRVGRVHGANLIFSQSWLNQAPLFFASFVISILLIKVTLDYPQFTMVSVIIGGVTVLIPVLFVVPFILISKATFAVLNERFVLAPEYMVHISGRLSWKERTVRLEYDRIQEIEINQTIPQRLFNLGDIIIIPIAGTTQTTIDMHGVSSPRLVKDAIREKQHQEE